MRLGAINNLHLEVTQDNLTQSKDDSEFGYVTFFPKEEDERLVSTNIKPLREERTAVNKQQQKLPLLKREKILFRQDPVLDK